MVKKISSAIFVGVLLIQMLILSTFAADATLTLSADNGYAGNNITVSGTGAPNEWITVRAVDSDGDIIYIEPVLSESDGTFSTDFVVPDIDAATITLIAGSGGDVATANFIVAAHSSDPSRDNEKAEITNSDGETITGTVEETDSGCNITIDGDDFSAVSGGSVKIETQYVTITFDPMAANYISHAAGSGSIVLGIANVDKSALPDEAQALIGDRLAYEFTLSADGKDLSGFGGGLAYVSIPYTPADNEDVNRIVIYYISDSGELVVMTNSVYDGSSINAVFSTSHFSVYAVGYNEVAFSDVFEDAWYYDAVTFCAAREITTGTGDSLFSPDTTLTRGQFIVMLLRACGIEAGEKSADNFEDAGNTYYTGYLAAAKGLGITNGVGGNRFAPEQAITRQEMFTMLYNMPEVSEKLSEGESGKTISDFTDAGDVASWAREAMTALVKVGTISGSGGKLSPEELTTRAEMAQVLYNLMAR